jgi:intergrase/recombinase
VNFGAPAGIRTRVFGSKGLQNAQIFEMGLNWASLRAGFSEYLESKSYSSAYADDLLTYLDRNLTVINGPADIIGIFSRVKSGRRHVWLGLRVLFNYLEALGYDAELLNILRKSLPKVSCGVDLKFPEETAIIKSLSSLGRAPRKYQALFNLLLDSGLRLVEAVQIIQEFKAERVERINGFYRVEIGAFRGTKQAFYGYFSESTFKMLTASIQEPLNWVAASRYYQKFHITSPKYERKFAFDKMVELEIPESVADFIEGRVPKRIGAKHYMVLRRQADKFYHKYMQYLVGLRKSL